jgi:hypothetical protein
LGRAAENVGSPGNFEIHKTGHDHGHLQLCFQQSAGNSAGPQIYLAFGALRHNLLHQDVAKLQATA